MVANDQHVDGPAAWSVRRECFRQTVNPGLDPVPR